jgi:hypothetical protein
MRCTRRATAQTRELVGWDSRRNFLRRAGFPSWDARGAAARVFLLRHQFPSPDSVLVVRTGGPADDAAHCASPNSGQSTTLAVVGGYALAGELSTAAGDCALAVARCQRLLRDFVARNHVVAPTVIKQFVSPGPLMVRARLADPNVA